ncbi:hypothetical protein EV673_1782 [Limnobacter thiooxidans]|uniref:Uncharacterized protein n=1 Tax=Limnobacter thiooxidans TaxID=131080 RepID=A0AA86JMP2_9BURK|nr:hypothetical protein EV673_1782 [Limnobacter thiooxidans]BET27547.1 hypothetical protein RGQ30_30480 [Limnobacter thiooxidans]
MNTAAATPNTAASSSMATASNTPPITADSLIQDWMDKNGIEDLSKLSLTDLQNLIKSLSKTPNASGVSSILSQLKQQENAWKSAGNGKNELSNKIDELKFQQKCIDTLAKATKGPDELDTASKTIATSLQGLEKLNNTLLKGSLSWEEDSGPATKEAITSLLAQLDGLKAAGQDLEKLGLQGLYTQMTEANATYTSALTAAGTDDAKTKIAGSDLRKNLATAFKEYYLSAGLSETHGLVQREGDTAKGESVYQGFLTTPMDENWRPHSAGSSKKEVQNALDESHRMFKEAEAKGDTDGMKYFKERMGLLRTAGEKLADGKTRPLVAVVEMYIGLINLDSVRLTGLRQNALDAGEQDLADKIKTRIDEIGQLIQEVVKGQVKLLDNEQNMMAAIRT